MLNDFTLATKTVVWLITRVTIIERKWKMFSLSSSSYYVKFPRFCCIRLAETLFSSNILAGCHVWTSTEIFEGWSKTKYKTSRVSWQLNLKKL
jgi:hypothetical protein